MGRTVGTEIQCLYKGTLYIFIYITENHQFREYKTKIYVKLGPKKEGI